MRSECVFVIERSRARDNNCMCLCVSLCVNIVYAYLRVWWKKPTLPGCISVNRLPTPHSPTSLTPACYTAHDTNPFQPCLTRIWGKPGLMDTCSWMAITALYTPQLIPESTGGCPEYTTIKCVKLQRGKSWKENIMVVLVQANTYNMYMHGLLLSATRQHKPFLTYWQGWSTALACCCGRCPVSQTHLL